VPSVSGAGLRRSLFYKGYRDDNIIKLVDKITKFSNR
jgi:hypothetical protein